MFGEPTGRSSRPILVGVALLSGLAILTGLVLNYLWNSQLEDLEPRYFTTRGVAWGQHYRSELESRLKTLQEGQGAADWKARFPEVFVRQMDQELGRIPQLSPGELSLMERDVDGSWKLAATLGRRFDATISRESWTRHLESGFEVAVVSGDPLTNVYVEGPVTGDEEGPEEFFRFRCVIQFDTIGVLTTRGRRTATIILWVFSAVLYLNFLAVYFIGRRQASISFRTREKGIRLAAMGAAAEGIAHEVRNPLNAVSLMVQYLEKALESGREPTSGDYQRVYMELGKIRKVIDNFVGFVKLRDIELSEWSVKEVVEESVENMVPVFEQAGIACSVESEGETMVRGDRSKVVEVFRSIMLNAVDALADSEKRVLDVRIKGGQKQVRIEFQDSGIGPGESVLERMFEPFFSTNSNAMGLGMTLAKTVVESHGGSISASGTEKGGCLVQVVLPRRF